MFCAFMDIIYEIIGSNNLLLKLMIKPFNGNEKQTIVTNGISQVIQLHSAFCVNIATQKCIIIHISASNNGPDIGNIPHIISSCTYICRITKFLLHKQINCISRKTFTNPSIRHITHRNTVAPSFMSGFMNYTLITLGFLKFTAVFLFIYITNCNGTLMFHSFKRCFHHSDPIFYTGIFAKKLLINLYDVFSFAVALPGSFEVIGQNIIIQPVRAIGIGRGFIKIDKFPMQKVKQ